MSADRLTGLDASFLHLERGGAHMHVASTLIFDGPPPPFAELRAHLASRLHLVPRFRQRLRTVPFGQGRPVWVDDPRLNLDYHLRYSALPAPGSEEQLRTFAARVFSQRLDRSKPLWEMWLVDGLQGGRFAIVAKSHHCLVDGVSGVDVTTVLFDADPEPDPAPGAAEVGAAAGADRDRTARPRARRAAGRSTRGGTHGARPGPPPASGAGGAPRRRRGGRLAGRRRLRRSPLAVQRADRLSSPLRLGTRRPEPPARDQGRARWHGQRRRADRRRRRPRPLPAGPRECHQRARAAGDGPGQRARRGGARGARQPGRGDDGPAARLVHRSGSAARPGARVDGPPEGLQAERRRGPALRADRLRAADDRRPGGARCSPGSGSSTWSSPTSRARSSRSTCSASGCATSSRWCRSLAVRRSASGS